MGFSAGPCSSPQSLAPAGRPKPGPAPSAGHLGRQVRDDHLPLGVGQVTGITPHTPPSGQECTWGRRELSCLAGRHKSGSWGPRLASHRHSTPPPSASRPTWHRARTPTYQTLTEGYELSPPQTTPPSGSVRHQRRAQSGQSVGYDTVICLAAVSSDLPHSAILRKTRGDWLDLAVGELAIDTA